MRIALIGAYGYTGRLISRELIKRKIPFSAIGRDADKLHHFKDEQGGGVPVLQADIRQKETVDAVITQFDLYINCAGPFNEESQVLLEACVNQGKIYLDISGELGFIKHSREQYHKKAIETGALVIHGCAFESLLADLGIQLMTKELQGVKEVQTFYWFNKMLVSPGTKLTMKLSKYRELLSIKNHSWVTGTPGDKWQVSWGQELNYQGIIYPLPEVAYVHWNHQVENCCSYLLLDPDDAKYYQFEKTVAPVTLEILDRLRKRKAAGPTPEARKEQESIIVIRAKDEVDQEKYMTIASTDMYQTTAMAIVLAIEKILEEKETVTGVVPPASLFAGEETENFTKLNAIVKKEGNIVFKKM